MLKLGHRPKIGTNAVLTKPGKAAGIEKFQETIFEVRNQSLLVGK